MVKKIKKHEVDSLGTEPEERILKGGEGRVETTDELQPSQQMMLLESCPGP